jgi:predicted amidohydrolase YtcJ
MRPLQWMGAAVNHSNPEQRIGVAEALHCCTLAGARLAFQEHDRGSLAVGKLGDFVLLSADPHIVNPGVIQDSPVLATVVGGSVVWEQLGHE